TERHRRVFRVQFNGGDVELKLRLRTKQEELAHAVYVHTRDDVETNPHPIRVLIFEQFVLHATDLECRAIFSLDRDDEGQLEMTAICMQRIRRADELRPHGVTFSDNGVDLPTRLFSLFMRPGRV